MQSQLVRASSFVALASALWLASPADAQGTARAPVSVGQAQLVGRNAQLGTIIDATVASDGRVYVVDYSNTRVVAFSPEGRLLWRFGRRGRGPGEFEMPYRVAAHPDGTVFVLDIGAGAVTAVSPDGGFLGRYRLPFAFNQADGLVALSGDRVVISGTAFSERRAARSGVHRFRLGEGRLEYLGSFGPLPAVDDTEVLAMWGAGSVGRTGAGELLFTRRIPYEVYRYDFDGRLKQRIQPPFRTRGRPEQTMHIARDDEGVTYTNTGADVEVPGKALELPGGWLAVGRYSARAPVLDLYTPTGRYAGNAPLSLPGASAAVGYDGRRRVLWLTGEKDLEPVLLRVPFTVRGG
jgi:hypothetical protein